MNIALGFGGLDNKLGEYWSLGFVHDASDWINIPQDAWEGVLYKRIKSIVGEDDDDDIHDKDSFIVLSVGLRYSRMSFC